MSRCPFCRTMMDDQARGGMGPPEWVCPTCGLEANYGITRLPDPDKLRRRSETLADMADRLEEGGPLVDAIHEWQNR